VKAKSFLLLFFKKEVLSTDGKRTTMGRVWPIATTAACVVFATIILAHAGLLSLSRWQADEYLDFAFQRQFGWHYVVGRYWTWSARLWSEMLLALYGAAVNAAHRPLAARCDALLWAGLAVACLGPAWFGSRAQAAAARARRLALGLALFAFFLLGHGITEVFYWPAGAIAYIPTLAAATWLFWCVADGVAGRRVSAACALGLAAGSSEVGIFLVIGFSALALAWRKRAEVLSAPWLLPGVALACLDFWIVLHGRVGKIEILGPDSAYVHHAAASLGAALPGFLLDIVSSGRDVIVPGEIATHVAADLLLLLGGWCLAGSGGGAPDRGLLLLPLALALLVAAFATRAAALYQFGTICCERHETMRQCFIVLALLAIGLWAGKRWPPHHVLGTFAPAPLVVASLVLGVPRVPDLAADYRVVPRALAARARTWQSGLGADSDAMTLVIDPNGVLIQGGGGFSPGVYRLGKDTLWYNRGVMAFFGKKVLTVVLPPA